MTDKIKLIKINTFKEAEQEFRELGVDEGGLAFLIPKAIHLTIKLKGLKPEVATILKQEMLARGGDAAVNREVITHSIQESDVILLGTVAQFMKAIKKLKVQPFGLKKIAREIEEIIDTLE